MLVGPGACSTHFVLMYEVSMFVISYVSVIYVQ
jgi:hypothetical protein